MLIANKPDLSGREETKKRRLPFQRDAAFDFDAAMFQENSDVPGLRENRPTY